MSEKNLGVVVVGYGAMHNFGWIHAKWVQACPRTELIGICDLSEDRRKAALEDFSDISTYASLTDIWQDDRVDIATGRIAWLYYFLRLLSRLIPPISRRPNVVGSGVVCAGATLPKFACTLA
jgi:hypothetical protein